MGELWKYQLSFSGYRLPFSYYSSSGSAKPFGFLIRLLLLILETISDADSACQIVIDKAPRVSIRFFELNLPPTDIHGMTHMVHNRCYQSGERIGGIIIYGIQNTIDSFIIDLFLNLILGKYHIEITSPPLQFPFSLNICFEYWALVHS